MKIIDKIRASIAQDEVFASLEFSPPKTAAGVENLYTRMDHMATTLQPLFCDMTWGAGGSNAKLTLEMSATAHQQSGLEMLMHMTCTNLTEENALETLQKAKDAGIQNILALRGDPVRGTSAFSECDRGFSHAVDLVRFIKKHFGDYFGIAVAGYPEVHAEAIDRATDLRYLKEKIDAGADFVLTQLFYDVEVYIAFVKDCRAIGITCPIVPGIMPIHTYDGFVRMSTFCNPRVPEDIKAALEPIKSNDEAVKEYGIELGVQMSRALIAAGAPGLHYYTLNLERTVRCILHAVTDTNGKIQCRGFPWRSSTLAKRETESVRPIYWFNRPDSYVERTANWDEYPNGRWGSSESPAFGQLSAHQSLHSTLSAAERAAMWGEAPETIQDIRQVFVNFVRGSIRSLPWCDMPLQLETKAIQEKLEMINANGFLTVNSQPRVNAAPSDDAMFGWGGAGGYVFQKAYVECFVSPENMQKLIAKASTMPSIHYHAVDARGNLFSNGGKSAIAVTWGVFPNKEILQPTIVDSNSFMAWKDEAFALWMNLWGSLYAPGSVSASLLQQVHDTYFLVSIVDNDFINGNIWSVFGMDAINTNPAVCA